MRRSMSITRGVEVMRSAFPLFRRIRSISFSQYGEDLLFSLLHPRASGFYLDVGAYHPWMKSNTYKLYLRGWSGITIEPNPDTAHLFRRFRPRDLHLTFGVSGEASELTYFRYADPKLNTFVNLRKDCQTAGKPEKVKCLPLREIIAQWCPRQGIDLLSVDCEGLDFEVLTSVDFSVNRPVSINNRRS